MPQFYPGRMTAVQVVPDPSRFIRLVNQVGQLQTPSRDLADPSRFIRLVNEVGQLQTRPTHIPDPSRFIRLVNQVGQLRLGRRRSLPPRTRPSQTLQINVGQILDARIPKLEDEIRWDQIGAAADLKQFERGERLDVLARRATARHTNPLLRPTIFDAVRKVWVQVVASKNQAAPNLANAPEVQSSRTIVQCVGRLPAWEQDCRSGPHSNDR